MSRAFHAAVLDVGEVDYTEMFHVKHRRMPCLSLLAVRVHRDGLWRCDIHDAAAAEWCSVYIPCIVLRCWGYTAMFHVKHWRNWRA